MLRGLLSTQQDGLRQAALDCKQPLVVPLETTSSEQLHLLLQVSLCVGLSLSLSLPARLGPYGWVCVHASVHRHRARPG